jgi:hypothetical protein
MIRAIVEAGHAVALHDPSRDRRRADPVSTAVTSLAFNS